MNRTTIATFIAALTVAVTPAAAQAAARTAATPTGAPVSRTAPKPKPRTAHLEASGAGVAGFDDAKCQQLADFWGGYVDAASAAINRGDAAASNWALSEASSILSVIEDNCARSGVS